MFTISYRDEDGNEQIISGKTLESLQQQLAEAEYRGSTITVRDEPGFIVGYVSATDWRHS